MAISTRTASFSVGVQWAIGHPVAGICSWDCPKMGTAPKTRHAMAKRCMMGLYDR